MDNSRFIRVDSLQFNGVEKEAVTIEALKSLGMTPLTITGLPDSWLRESKDKIKALVVKFVPWGGTDRVLVQLFPPDMTKIGSHLELPIFLACLLALMKDPIPAHAMEKLKNFRFVGTLSLEGRIEETTLSRVFKFQDPAHVTGAGDFENLDELLKFLFSAEEYLPRRSPQPVKFSLPVTTKMEVRGRYWERFLLLLSAVQEGPALLLGPPGLGKTYLSKWAHGLLPEPPAHEASELMQIQSYVRGIPQNAVPFVNPHSRVHLSELLGVQSKGRLAPGLMSQAHGGLLVLDEFVEMNRDCREILRTVLDQKKIIHNLKSGYCEVPARFWLILTANPCACGRQSPGDVSACLCGEMGRRAYRSRLSGPLMDRMLVKMFLNPQEEATPFLAEDHKSLLDSDPATLQDRVQAARRQLVNWPAARLEAFTFASVRERKLKEGLLRAAQIFLPPKAADDFFAAVVEKERRDFSYEDTRVYRKFSL